MDINLPVIDPSLPFPLTETGTILVITGWRGVGKTAFCQRIVEEYRKAGLLVTGILSPGRYKDNQRNGVFAFDLNRNESRLVSSIVPGEIDGIWFGSWMFDSKVFDWGNQCLLNMTGADILVIDELGFLEFDLNTGWIASFEVLNRKNYHLAIVVIRPECIESFSKMGFHFQIKEILNRESPAHLLP